MLENSPNLNISDEPTYREQVDLDLLALMFSDAKCYREIALHLLSAINTLDESPKHGEKTAHHFLLLMFTLDLSVFVVGALELLLKTKGIMFDLDKIFEWPDFKKRLYSVRNGMHLYNKFGSYESKAHYNLATLRESFHTLKKDFFYFLRSDEAYIYEIANGFRYLAGSQFLITYHILDQRAFSWTGEEIQKYSDKVVSLVSALTKSVSFEKLNSEKYVLSFNMICVESFDDKIKNILGKLPVAESTAVRIMLVFTRISNAVFMHKLFIEGSQIQSSDEWLVFFTRWFAMYLDEALDSTDNLLKYCRSSEKAYIHSLYIQINCNISTELREMIRKARNLVHYDVKNKLQYSTNCETIDFLRPCCFQIGLYTRNEFSDFYNRLVVSIYSLQSCLCAIFGNKGQIRI